MKLLFEVLRELLVFTVLIMGITGLMVFTITLVSTVFNP